jgi:hypothetical protein
MAAKLVSNPVTQTQDAVEGLDYISCLLVQCIIVEETYDVSSPPSLER